MHHHRRHTADTSDDQCYIDNASDSSGSDPGALHDSTMTRGQRVGLTALPTSTNGPRPATGSAKRRVVYQDVMKICLQTGPQSSLTLPQSISRRPAPAICCCSRRSAADSVSYWSGSC